MSKIKIIEMKERMSFAIGGKRKLMLDIQYETPKGYVGVITLPKVGFSKDVLAKAIKGDMQEQEAVIGTDIDI